MDHIQSMKKEYHDVVVKELMKEFSVTNSMALPRIEKVVVNMGIGKVSKDNAQKEDAFDAMTKITGQRPISTKARKAIAGFKIREGLQVGTKVTIRGTRMWHFLDRLVHISLPRVRDFQGLEPKNIDHDGNLNIGIKDHTVFPEISPEHAKGIYPFQVTVVTTTKDRAQALELFKKLGFPIKK